MSPSFAPVSMNAAITSVYAVIASCTSGTVVCRSLTICEIDTFMTVLSSTITNWAVPSSRIVVRLRIGSRVQRSQSERLTANMRAPRSLGGQLAGRSSRQDGSGDGLRVQRAVPGGQQLGPL